MSAVDLAAQVQAALVKLAEISDRLGLDPVAVSLRVAIHGGQSVGVQFRQDDIAAVDALAAEIGADADAAYSPTLYDRKLRMDGVEWGAYCGITEPEDDEAAAEHQA